MFCGSQWEACQGKISVRPLTEDDNNVPLFFLSAFHASFAARSHLFLCVTSALFCYVWSWHIGFVSVCVCVERCAAGTGRASKTVRANQRPCQPWQAGHTHTHTFSFTFCQVFFSPNFGHVRPLVCVRVCVFHGWSLQMAEVTRLADVPTAWAALSISINLVFVPLFFPLVIC